MRVKNVPGLYGAWSAFSFTEKTQKHTITSTKAEEDTQEQFPALH